MLVLAAFNLAICLPLHIFAIGRDAPRDGESNYKATQKLPMQRPHGAHYARQHSGRSQCASQPTTPHLLRSRSIWYH
ncbi:hypothetical protein AX768_12260 [Burkholderia sp. PAMC 28687]|nr:hypothetical protein AX768_12260 [Burkholderia sp. PAMC 28687]